MSPERLLEHFEHIRGARGFAEAGLVDPTAYA
jgi:hypothetical protein